MNPRDRFWKKIQEKESNIIKKFSSLEHFGHEALTTAFAIRQAVSACEPAT